MIEQEVNTASRIINDLLDFGRIVSPERQPVTVPELLQRVLARSPAPPSVRVQLKLPASLPKVFADPLQLEQVLGNLTTNACQAMKDMKDGGKLTFSANLKKDQVAIAVKDTGTGITPEAMQRLFEPLFTTKLRGIGLGLAISKKLAEANGCRIAVRSQPGKGSTFTLYLPVKGS
jgi:signal transduction histidine kinase